VSELHPLCCDCDPCLNGSGGLRVPGAGIVVPEEVTPPQVPTVASEAGVEVRAAYNAAERAYREQARLAKRGARG
jgi:hypothetical protein